MTGQDGQQQEVAEPRRDWPVGQLAEIDALNPAVGEKSAYKGVPSRWNGTIWESIDRRGAWSQHFVTAVRPLQLVPVGAIVLLPCSDCHRPRSTDPESEEGMSSMCLRAEAADVYNLRERGVRVLGEEQCCELACDGGACESCPCCCAGWCVSGHSGTIPSRDLTPDSSYRIWLDMAAEHNPVAKLLAQIEGVAGLDYDEPAQPRPDVAEAVAEERQRLAAAVLPDHWQTSQMWGGERRLACGRCAYMDGVRFLWPCPTRRAITGEPEPEPDSALVAAGSVPVATPPTRCGDVSATEGWAPCDREAGHSGPHTWPLIPPPGPVATPVEPVDLLAVLDEGNCEHGNDPALCGKCDDPESAAEPSVGTGTPAEGVSSGSGGPDRHEAACTRWVSSFHDDEDISRCGNPAVATARTTSGTWEPICARHCDGLRAEDVQFFESAEAVSGGGVPAEPPDGGSLRALLQRYVSNPAIRHRMLAEVDRLTAEVARCGAAVDELHAIMDAAIVRGGYRPGESERVEALLAAALGDGE